jgi:hypothetical protein
MGGAVLGGDGSVEAGGAGRSGLVFLGEEQSGLKSAVDPGHIQVSE